MFERYTEQARKAVFVARYEASQCGSPAIETEHLLVGVLREDIPLARRLAFSPAKLEAIREQVRKRFPGTSGTSTSVDLPLSHASKRAVHYAAEEAKELKHRYIGTEHLLLGIAREESCVAAGILRENGCTPARLREEAIRRAEPGIAAKRLETSPVLLRDLIEAARTAESSPLIGRERELERIIQILSRRTSNNAVLIGEAGVGKTAIVEGLARRMAEGQVPSSLEDRRLLALDASSLIQVGQRGASFSQLQDALAGFTGPANIVLFVRGLFNLSAAGSAWAVVEAMHALEPLLAHGGLQCIATGSPEGLRQTAERAAMLARHFEMVHVAPVTEEDAIRIVSGLKSQFERFHDVVFADGAVEAAVYASGPFLPGRHLPDRAIDLLDEAATAVRLRQENPPREVAEAQVRIRKHVRAMENAIATHDFAAARRHSDEERREREKLEHLRKEHGVKDTPDNTVTPEDIAAAVAARAGVPLAAVRRVLEASREPELQRIIAELAAALPAENREWLPFLAAYLRQCSLAEAEALARVITATKANFSAPKGEAGS